MYRISHVKILLKGVGTIKIRGIGEAFIWSCAKFTVMYLPKVKFIGGITRFSGYIGVSDKVDWPGRQLEKEQARFLPLENFPDIVEFSYISSQAELSIYVDKVLGLVSHLRKKLDDDEALISAIMKSDRFSAIDIIKGSYSDMGFA